MADLNEQIIEKTNSIVEKLQDMYDSSYKRGSDSAMKLMCERSFTEVVIPDGVTAIGDSVFWNCEKLASVVIPNSVTTIGYSAFANCFSLTSIIIPDSVTSIHGSAFANCKGLAGVVIPNSVTSIDDYTFQSCSGLTSVTIPDNITSIDGMTFYGCSSLYVVYNNSDILLEIGGTNNGYVAKYAKVLVDNGVVTYANDGYEYTLTDSRFLFRYKDSKYELIAYAGDEETVTLPENINGSSYDIYNMRGVRNVIIPNGITSIGSQAFYNCRSLTSVVIGDSVTSIGDQAFYACTNLTSVAIPDSVTSIGEEAFYGCKSLTSVVIENPEGWWFAYSSTATSGTAITEDLSDPAVAATCLTSTYSIRYWKRTT